MTWRLWTTATRRRFEQVLADTQVAGPAALPVPDRGQGVPGRDPFPQFRTPVRILLAQPGQQRLLRVDGDAAAVAAGGIAGPQRAGRAGVLGKAGVTRGPGPNIASATMGTTGTSASCVA